MEEDGWATEPASDVPPAGPPHAVRFPVNLHRWETISFLHWPYEPGTVQRLLPEGLQVQTFDGAAWVGVTPFRIKVRLPGVPVLPRTGVFPETNVRTYVGSPDGRRGLWFLRMEVPALWFVGTLRAVGLPYHWQRMAIEQGDGRVTYVSTHRSPPGDPSHLVVVRPGAPLRPPEGGPRERFLTARWGAYHRRGPVLMYTPAEHPPWALHEADVEVCEVDPLLERAGLPPPDGPPLAHFSPGVPVRIGRPQVVIDGHTGSREGAGA